MDPCLYSHLLREHRQFLSFRKGLFLLHGSCLPLSPNITVAWHYHHAHIQLTGWALWRRGCHMREEDQWLPVHWQGCTMGIPLVWVMEWWYSCRILIMDLVEKGMDGNVTLWRHQGRGREGLIDLEGKVWASDAWYIVFLDDPIVYPTWFMILSRS